MKSLKADGSWDGTVYVVPFHSNVQITPIGPEEQSFHLTNADYTTGAITDLRSGDQIEIRFNVRTNDPGSMFTLLVLHDGVELGRFRKVVGVGNNWGSYHFMLQSQLKMDGITVLINSGERNAPTAYTQDIEIERFSVLRHKESITRFDYGINAGTPHQGGVTFDIFAKKNLTTQVIGGHGAISPGSNSYKYDSTILLTAEPDPGYEVAFWSGTDDDFLNTNTNQITLTDDAIVSVGFKLIADTNDDGCVDADDLGDMTTDWLSPLENSDLNNDGNVNWFDFSLMNLNWQDCHFVWMLSADWSDVSNPNGPWKYRSTTALLATNQSAWLPNDLGANQPAWADGAETIPGWYLSTGLGLWDVPEGTVACHSPAVIRWKSPIAGQIQISGNCWLTRDQGRTLQVKLKHSGVEFTSAVITRASGTSGSPFDFSQMSAGANVLTRNVQINDVIEFQTNANPGSFEDFLAVEINIHSD